MNRLPSYDVQTRGAEWGMFLGLALSAAALIVITAYDAMRFSGSEQEIAAALSRPTTTVAAVQTNATLTNFTVLRSGLPEERTRLEAAPRPKS